MPRIDERDEFTRHGVALDEDDQRPDPLHHFVLIATQKTTAASLVTYLLQTDDSTLGTGVLGKPAQWTLSLDPCKPKSAKTVLIRANPSQQKPF
jgi:hypothetical protein